MTPQHATPPEWWNRRSVLVACVLLALVPLLLPTIPPLVDVPGHMGRYAVQLDPVPFRDWYAFHWQLIGNLGVDLLIEPMGRLFGVELGTKLIVMAIPALAVAGLLWIAREVHGRVPPTAFFSGTSFDITPKITLTAGGRLYKFDNSLIGFFGFGRNPGFVQGAEDNPPPNPANGKVARWRT